MSGYRGRFAPSPSGPLHLGSLYAALASFLHARANNGQWLLRIDDLDSFRNVSGATESIIESLQTHGLHWDSPIYYQSHHQDSYLAAIKQLHQLQLLYRCQCTRKQLAAQGCKIYPRTCLTKKIDDHQACSLRIKTTPLQIRFYDELQKNQTHDLAHQHGDFIVKRKDDIIAYQLAVVVDDSIQQINHVVRGVDLLDSTPKQIYLQQILGYDSPHYCHIPVIVDSSGYKLSKQTFAQAVSNQNPGKNLFFLLQLLKQNPPARLKTASIADILNWAIDHWQVNHLEKIRAIDNRFD